MLSSGHSNSYCKHRLSDHPNEDDDEGEDFSDMPLLESDEEAETEAYNHRFWAADSSDDE